MKHVLTLSPVKATCSVYRYYTITLTQNSCLQIDCTLQNTEYCFQTLQQYFKQQSSKRIFYCKCLQNWLGFKKQGLMQAEISPISPSDNAVSPCQEITDC